MSVLVLDQFAFLHIFYSILRIFSEIRKNRVLSRHTTNFPNYGCIIQSRIGSETIYYSLSGSFEKIEPEA